MCRRSRCHGDRAGFPQLRPRQNRIDTSGHALDANTQVGSGGYNITNGNQTANYQTYQNAIATNNVGNGYAFRGATVHGVNLGAGYTDPFAFRGLLPGQGVDQFVANSTGVPTMANPMASSDSFAQPANQSLTYYGTANHAAPPPGYMTGPYNQNYVPTAPIVQNPQDTRLGTIDYSGQSSSQQIIPKPNEMMLPGPVDPTANPATPAQQMLAASPLYGMRQWDTSQGLLMPTQANQTWQAGSALTPLQQGFAANLPSNFEQGRITQMQQQLSQSTNWTGPGGQNQNPNNPNGSSNNPNSVGGTQLQPIAPNAGNSSNQPLAPLVPNSNLQVPSNSIAGGYSSPQSTRNYLTNAELPPPARRARNMRCSSKSSRNTTTPTR